MPAYYNEIDRNAAAWLRELIKRGLIADGEVDERDMRDVDPDELAGYRQLHFCAGIGTWAYALRQAGWPDDRPVCTFSLPCQPFSAAGKRKSHEDERHLWPTMFGIIRKLRPECCFGEQVASRDGLAWFDAVSADLESEGYAVGAVDICAAGFGAPHIRQRLYFCAVGNAEIGRREGNVLHPIRSRRDCGEPQPYASGPSPTGELADAEIHGSGPFDRESGASVRREEPVGGRSVSHLLVQPIGPRIGGGDQPGLGDSRKEVQEREDGARPPIEPRHGGEDARLLGDTRNEGLQRSKRCGQHDSEDGTGKTGAHGTTGEPSACNGFWSDAEWIPCRDNKWRAVEPGDEQMADGLAGELGLVRLESYPGRPHEERIIYSPLIQKGKARVMRLRGYGNSIVAPQATEFIEAYMKLSRASGEE